MDGDLRKSSRVPAQHFISYDVLGENGEITLSGMGLSRDLSRTGVQLEDRHALPTGSNILLHLAVEDRIIDLNGVVRHVEKLDENRFTVGVEFLDIGEKVLQEIGQFYPGLLKD